MAIETEINTTHDPESDPTGLYPWIATIETKEYGTFFGYGQSEKSAIEDAEIEMNWWIDTHG